MALLTGTFTGLEFSKYEEAFKGHLNLKFSGPPTLWPTFKCEIKVEINAGLRIKKKGRRASLGAAQSSGFDKFDLHCPIQWRTVFPSDSGQRAIVSEEGELYYAVKSKVPHGLTLPTPFECSQGGIYYTLLLLYKRLDIQPATANWEQFGRIPLTPNEFRGQMNFDTAKGFLKSKLYLELRETNQIPELCFVSVFKVIKCYTSPGGKFEGSLSLEELRGQFQDIHGTEIKCKVMLESQEIFPGSIPVPQICCQSRQEFTEGDLKASDSLNWKWSLIVPFHSKVTHVSQRYSVVYSIKYEITMDLGLAEQWNIVMGEGDATVVVGSEDDCSREFRPVASGSGQGLFDQSSRTSSCSSQRIRSDERSLPSYSQLSTPTSSRCASVLSLETLPPHYDDI